MPLEGAGRAGGVLKNNIMPCRSQQQNLFCFSCSLVRLRNECFLPLPISLKSDHIFEEQNSCSGGDVEGRMGPLSREGLPTWVLFAGRDRP